MYLARRGTVFERSRLSSSCESSNLQAGSRDS
jgi:hypothetical protein